MMNQAMRQFFSVADLVQTGISRAPTTEAMASAAEEVAIQSSTIATASEEMAATSGDIARNCPYALENAQKGRPCQLTGQSFERGTGDRATHQGVLQHTQINARFAGLGAAAR